MNEWKNSSNSQRSIRLCLQTYRCTLNRMNLFHQRDFHLKNFYLFSLSWIKQTNYFILFGNNVQCRSMKNGQWKWVNNETGKENECQEWTDKMICSLTLGGLRCSVSFIGPSLVTPHAASRLYGFDCGHTCAFCIRDCMYGHGSSSHSFR